MNKLNIDGKPIDSDVCDVTRVWHSPADIRPTRDAGKVHADGECRSLPTYFCAHCAREAMLKVDLANPWGER